MSECGLQDDDKQVILDILKTYSQIEDVVLFGSRALNTFKSTSDIDLAIKGKDIHTIIAALIADFEESDLIYEVDLVDYASISTEKLIEHIDRHGVSFYRKGWIDTTIGEIVTVGRGSSPRPIHDYLSSTGIPWVKIADATASPTRFIKNTKECIKEEGRSTSVIPGDLIVSNSATPGIPKVMDIEACVHDGWLVFKDYGDIDKWYLFYFFLDFRKRLSHSASGTVFKNLKIDIVRAVPISLPPLSEQKSIVNILSSFDEKIELLREQNKTLETLAQTIFKEWFVNFNYPGVTGEMIESELGVVPEGWRVGVLGDVIKTNISSINRDFEKDVIQYLDTGSITEGHIESTQKLRLADAPSRARRIVRHNDILISTVRPNLRHYGILKEPENNFIVSTGFCVISCNKADPHFVYYFLTTNEMTDYLHSVAEGSTSTYPSIKPSDIEKVELVLPPDNILKLFSAYADKAWNKIMFNQEQIKMLSKTRDTILPKLMMGIVRVGGS